MHLRLRNSRRMTLPTSAMHVSHGSTARQNQHHANDEQEQVDHNRASQQTTQPQLDVQTLPKQPAPLSARSLTELHMKMYNKLRAGNHPGRTTHF